MEWIVSCSSGQAGSESSATCKWKRGSMGVCTRLPPTQGRLRGRARRIQLARPWISITDAVVHARVSDTETHPHRSNRLNE